MEHFYIITNPSKDIGLETSRRVKEYLEQRGKTCVVDTGAANKKQEGYTDKAQVGKETDCVIVLGGDGTLLQAASDLVDRDIPFLGINLGTLGFLAEVDKANIETALDKLLAGDYEIENRMMLHGTCFVDGQTADETMALNDIVITRRGSLQIINFTIYVNGQLLHRYHADGIIVATPTGSTGYNLSAGGPVVEPRASLMVISPVCPHSMQNRSIVLSAEDTVTVEIESSRDGSMQEVEATFDGSHRVVLHTGDRIRIVRSQKTTGIVRLGNASFLEILHRKMNE